MDDKKIKQQVIKLRKEDILERFDSHLGVSFPHRFEKPHIIKEIKSADKVLDIGCGIGQTTLEFAEFIGSKGSITGIDFSPKRIEEARRLASATPYKEKVHFLVEDAESLNLPDGSYTLIVSQGVLLHLTQKEAAVREMFRVLKPQGRVIISMVALEDGASLDWEKDMTGVPMEWLSISDYEKMFIRNGFKIDSRIDLSKEMRNVLAKASGRYAEAFSRVPKNWCYPLWKLIKYDIKQINKPGDEIREKVRENYGKIAQGGLSCGCSSSSNISPAVKDYTKKIGYKEEELSSVPKGANLGLGCGNPVALASLKEGDVILDLGSGAGFDAFLAAQRVGKSGRVIGVDMTPQMIKKAKENAKKAKYSNVEFRLGEIENLPVAGNSIDVIISNCVINLSPDKERVFKEAYRVLKTGGRLMVSDIVLEKPLPSEVREDIEAYVGCIAGASLEKDYLDFIKDAGFEEVKIVGSTSWTMDDNEIKDKIKQSKIGQSLLDKLGGNDKKLADIRVSIKSIKVSAVK